MRITTSFGGNDPLGLGIEKEVFVELDEPVLGDVAWKVVFRLSGENRTFETHTYGETPLQALFLATKFIRDLHESE
ncbi:MAG: hypothetical protein AAFQ24_08975 [Pseudomonadota bacterium]